MKKLCTLTRIKKISQQDDTKNTSDRRCCILSGPPCICELLYSCMSWLFLDPSEHHYTTHSISVIEPPQYKLMSLKSTLNERNIL